MLDIQNLIADALTCLVVWQCSEFITQSVETAFNPLLLLLLVLVMNYCSCQVAVDSFFSVCWWKSESFPADKGADITVADQNGGKLACKKEGIWLLDSLKLRMIPHPSGDIAERCIYNNDCNTTTPTIGTTFSAASLGCLCWFWTKSAGVTMGLCIKWLIALAKLLWSD